MSGKDESSVFDSAWYLAEYPDVAQSGMDPFAHYQWIGRAIGRRPCARPEGSNAARDWVVKPDGAPKGDGGSLARFYELAPLAPGEPGPPLSLLMRYIWNTRPDLQAHFDLETSAGREAYLGWFHHSIGAEYGLPSTAGTPIANAREDGVNLIGYARATSGMGEHVRMVASAIASHERPFSLVDVPSASTGDDSVAHWISNDQAFRTNIFHVNADMFPTAALKYGHGHYNIGYWAWELANCPPEFDPALQLVDEIWGISEFVSDAFRARANVPVHTLPLAVKVPDLSASDCRKARFGLEEEPFTFLFTFDAASYLDRKNPIDTVRAFKKAFPTGDENVRLVLKTHGVARVIGNPQAHFLWHELLNEIGDNPRIQVIDRNFGRDEVFALAAACDAFVSLHRSEGFGRNLAEAMSYGRPVIATGYSGSNEFIRVGSAVPVEYRLVPVGEGAYLHTDGQHWAQPDIDHAAWAMRRLVDDNAWYQEIAGRGRALIREEYNERVIGQRYLQRLDALASKVQIAQTATPSTAVSRLRQHVGSKQTVLFTVVSCNYMAFARSVLQSVRAQHPEFALFICLVDEGEGLEFPEMEEFQVVRVRDMDLPNFVDMRLRYDVMELNTAVKPFFIDWVYAQTGVDKVIYFDPDLFLYSPLDEVLGPLDNGHSVVLTPHINRPIEDDGCSPSDHSMLQAGVFNLGFIATRRTDETRRFVQWWAKQLETAAISDISNNLFTDQRWCDLAPCFLPKLKVLHHSGHNVAYWNLDQRVVARSDDGRVTVNGERLVFFHFSGFHPRKVEEVSKHQTRFSWANISATTKELMSAYAERLLDNGYETATKTAYSYNEIDGLDIRPVMRQAYRAVYPRPHSFRSISEARARLAQLCLEPVDVTPGDGGPAFSRLMIQIYKSRPDVQAAFPLASAEGAAGFRGWYNHSINREYNVDLPALMAAGVDG
jgi:glycosyltransferase involved in cell wall biosynthesis